MTNKYLFIGKYDRPQGRGAFWVAKRFAENHQEIDFIEEKQIKDINNLKQEYKKLIFTYQSPLSYHINLFKELIKNDKNVAFYIRDCDIIKFCNSISNGFSYYNSYKIHKHYIPYICDYEFNVKNPSNISIGFYLRPNMINDSYNYLLDILQTTKYKFNLVTCGEIPIKNFKQYNSILEYKHTLSTEEFFNSITHYLYPMSKIFNDPWPNTLMEAIQTNKQIICPKIKDRNHKDGIDDILSILAGGYHKNLNNLNIEYNNQNHGLLSKNFNNFYEKILNNNYENFLDYNKYKTFYDWCSHEL